MVDRKDTTELKHLTSNLYYPFSVSMPIQKYKKMVFVMNAIENGWKVKKVDESFIFTKKHEGKKEIFSDNYLEQFLNENIGEPMFISAPHYPIHEGR